MNEAVLRRNHRNKKFAKQNIEGLRKRVRLEQTMMLIYKEVCRSRGIDYKVFPEYVDAMKNEAYWHRELDIAKGEIHP